MTEEKDIIHVLLIDDDFYILDIGEQFLQQFGDIKVTTCSDALSAIELIRNNEFDAIVSDYLMPGMDGIGFLGHLRSVGNITPFIFFTGRGKEKVVIEALNTGADFYIQKTGDTKADFAELINSIKFSVSRRRSEIELERALKNLQRSQEVAHIGNWTLNLDIGTITGSDESLRIFGFPLNYTPKIAEIMHLIHPDDRLIVKTTISQVIETGEPYNIDIRILRFDTNELRYIQSQGYLWKTDNSGGNKIFGTILDITERKTAEEALIETNSYLENLINIASVPIIILDPEYNITRINRSGEYLIGLNNDQIIGKNIRQILPPDKVDNSMKDIIAALKSPEPKVFRLEIMQSSGSIRMVLWNSATLFDKDGKNPISTIFQGQDITSSIRLEKQRNATQIQIQENLAKMAILNDGIRNPLMAISGYAELFGNDNITEKILYQVDLIDQMVAQIDKKWAKSEKILNFLRKHCEVDTGVKTECEFEKIEEAF